MADVFISYKREEREKARMLAEALGAHGYGVWWDAELLPGEQYRAVTLEILQSCRVAIVMWTPLSVTSNWVLDEATRALQRGVLVPVMSEPLEALPLGFGQVHTHDLIGWNGEPEGAAFQPVLAAVARLAGPPVRSRASPRTEADVAEEVGFWRGVQDSREAAYFEGYLARYPNGLFVDLARERVAELRVSPKRPKAVPRKRKASATGSPQKSAPDATAPTSEATEPVAQPQRTPAASATSAPDATASTQSEATEPAREPQRAPRPPFTVWELAFIAATVFIAAIPAWPFANGALGAGDLPFYPGNDDYMGDIALLFSLETPQNVFLMTPLLTALAWGYDRAAAWWLARGRWPSAPVIATTLALAVFFLISLRMRDNYGRETHFAVWLWAAFGAAVAARPATAGLRELVLSLRRSAGKDPQKFN